MSDIKTFENENFGAIRVIEKDSEPWFVGKDVAEVLGYSNASKAVIDHVDDEDKQFIMIGVADSRNGNLVKTAIINESGLYSLILSSKLESAKKFKHWVTSEVLPSIRKHGAYMTTETLEAAILNPDTMIKLCQALKDEQDRNRQLEAVNSALTVDKAIMQPKADYFDELVDRNLLTNFRETAKRLGIKQRQFVDWLLAHKYIYRDKKGKLMPYAGKGDDLFEIKECFNDKTEWSGTQTLITPKGRETFRLLIVGN